MKTIPPGKLVNVIHGEYEGLTGTVLSFDQEGYPVPIYIVFLTEANATKFIWHDDLTISITDYKE